MTEEAKKSDANKKEANSVKDEHTIPVQCTSPNDNAELMKVTSQPDNLPDDTNLPSISVSDEGDDNEEHSTTSGPRGLGLLIQNCFGKPLDKSQQLSDWERRPLKPEQIYYAGIHICTIPT